MKSMSTLASIRTRPHFLSQPFVWSQLQTKADAISPAADSRDKTHNHEHMCRNRAGCAHSKSGKFTKDRFYTLQLNKVGPETRDQHWCFSWMHARDTPSHCYGVLVAIPRDIKFCWSSVFCSMLYFLPILSWRPSLCRHQGVCPHAAPLVLNWQVARHILQRQCINSVTVTI